jgi:acyl carrier protein
MARRFVASQSRGDRLGPTNKDDISSWLCDWFLSRKKFKGDAARLFATNYFDAGLLTSLEVIEFVSEIEDRFSVHFSGQDFQDPRFAVVSGLAELITQLCAQSSSTAKL